MQKNDKKLSSIHYNWQQVILNFLVLTDHQLYATQSVFQSATPGQLQHVHVLSHYCNTQTVNGNTHSHITATHRQLTVTHTVTLLQHTDS